LLLAKAQARQLRQRGRVLLSAGAGVTIVILALFVSPSFERSTAQRIAARPNLLPTLPTNGIAHNDAKSPAPCQIIITFIATEANISSRLAVPPRKASWQKLNDDELIQQLDAAGCPAGLAWIDGREMVMFRHPPAGEHS